jgi:Ca-activated chloride channel family protein
MKTNRKLMRWIAAAMIATGWMTAPVRGAGLLVADGGLGGALEIVEHDVNVTINNGVAVTKVTQVFLNLEDRQVEALYTFPVPRGASVANFSMWINGTEVVGEVLEKQRAREIYNSYKQVRRDPGLLEQVDYRTFEMRIFPIGPKAEQRVEITYYQELEIDHDTLRYVYPLATTTRQDIQAGVTGRFAMQLHVRSMVPIKEVVSPSHAGAFVFATHTEDYVQASLENRGGRLDEDIVLNCTLSRPKTGLDLITSKEKNEDGYFMMTLTAGEDLAAMDDSMDYVFVLDISGSMGNDGKLGLSRESIMAFIDGLETDDRFDVMTFNIQPTTLFGALQPAAGNANTEARRFLDQQSARGGTVLNSAITTAYKYADPDRVLNVVILSDGMTEQRERAALLELIRQRPANCRVFCIGVGNDVNRPLLEQVAEDSGGLAAFLSRGDNYQQAAKAFRRKLMRPAAANLTLTINGLDVYDVEPKTLPNLYHGMPIRIYGRYRGDGQASVQLKGDVRGKAFTSGDTMTFPKVDDSNPEIERMWAWKRVDQLQKEADRTNRRGDVIPEIIHLGETYSIVTEYTSFLVLENDAEYQRWQIERKNARRTGRDRDAQRVRDEQLEMMRNRALSGVGPDALHLAKNTEVSPTPVPGSSTPSTLPARTAPTQTRDQGRSIDFNVGTGPVGPLFILISAWMARRRKHFTTSHG